MEVLDMKRVILLLVFVSLLAVSFGAAWAAETFTFNFQGRLSDASGNPVPHGSYQMTFFIYADSIGGTPLWTETHSAVPVDSGYFNVQLGSTTPCSLSLASRASIYLATQIGSLPPLSGRFRIAASPHSGVARRMYGDLETGQGRMLIRSAGGDSIFSMNSIGSVNAFQIYAQIPPDPWAPAIEMKTDAATQINSIRLGNPPDPYAPAIEMETDALAQTGSIRLTIPPEPFAPAIEIKTDAATQTNSIRLDIPPDPWTPAVEILATSAGGGINLYDNIGRRMGVDATPWNPGLSLKLYQAIESPADRVSFNLAVDAAGAMMQFFDDGSEFMGVEPSAVATGGVLTMSNLDGAHTMVMSSEGKLSIGTGSTSNILTVRSGSSTDPIADAWTTYSSRRWKTNVQPLQGSLEKVMGLQGVSYDEREGGRHNIGLIAEDVGQVVPEVVAYEENGVDARSVDYARLTTLLIEAVKEQQKKIEQLTSEINELKLK
jgi:hypothetical protein